MREEIKKEQTTIRLPKELKEKLQGEADKIGISFNELLILILNEFMPRLTELSQAQLQTLLCGEE